MLPSSATVGASLLTFTSGSSLGITINGNTAFTQYQQLDASGTVNLGNTILSLSGSYTPTNTDVFTIVSANSVTGIFNGLPNDSTISLNGVILVVQYTANTVTLAKVIVPSVTTPPINQTVAALSPVTFIAAATGTPTPTVQWYVSSNGGSTFTADIADSGNTSNSITFTTSYSENGNKYEAVYTNPFGSATTTAVSLTVNQLTPTVTVADAGGVYNTTAYAVSTASVTGLNGITLASFGDASLTYQYYVGASATGTPSTTAPTHAGTYTVVAHWNSTDQNYASANSGSVTFAITPRSLGAAIIGTPTMTYDGSTGATLTPSNFSLSGLVGSDSFTVTQTAGLYNSKDVTASNVTTTLTSSNFTPLGSTVNTDYSLSITASGAGSITAKTLSASIIGTPTKTYDGNASAALTASNFSLPGLVGSDSFSVTQTAGLYNSKDVTASTVTATLTAGNFTSLGSTVNADYTLPTTASGAGRITAKTLSASIVGTPTKTYDGNTSATLKPSNFSLSGLVGSESFTVTQTAGLYNSKDVTASSVTASLTGSNFTPLSSTLVADYNFPVAASGAATITPATLTAAIVGPPTKVKDGSVNATLTPSNFSLSGLIGSESFTVTQTQGVYNSTDVTASSVTAALAAANFTPLSATLAADYLLPTTATGPGSIILGPPMQIAATSGSNQSASVNTAYASPLVATVTDANGNPLPNETVTFVASGAGVTFSGGNTAITNAQGQASKSLTADSSAGLSPVTATVSGLGTQAIFFVTISPGSAGTITPISGGGQSATVNAAFANPLVAIVTDTFGNPVPNVTVTFTDPSGGPGVAFNGDNTSTTNAKGQAIFPATANASAGNYTVTATATGVTSGALVPAHQHRTDSPKLLTGI